MPSNNLNLCLQIESDASNLPSQTELLCWANTAIDPLDTPCELVIRIVDEAESQMLNQTYRHKDTPTNVLAFAADAQMNQLLDKPEIGSLVICAAVVQAEAEQQHKALNAHWAHMVIHGCLHLLGYDHQTATEAEQMEKREIALLKQLGLANPYQSS